MSERILDRVVVVLDHPQNVVNIAAVIRAMKNMGVHRLRLVNPAEFDPYRIEGIAHRSTDVIEGTETFTSLEEALADCVRVVGASARSRTAVRNYTRPRPAAESLLEAAPDGNVALLFGREDRGLDNDALDLCHAIAVIPTDPDYSSLNLAQAVMVILYEVFLASDQGDRPLPRRGKRANAPATREHLEHMYGALEKGLDRIQFFKARKSQSVITTLRTVFARAGLDVRESRLIAAIGFEIGHFLDRLERSLRGTGPGEADPTSESDSLPGTGDDESSPMT
ncbi:MAG: RNA methyltransferase [Gemmatimonadales bacterium]|jgi:TrmH family RNA methyltransferase|nr:MAG: RNA methyltransferase [Gemmatimonadales bacterium]